MNVGFEDELAGTRPVRANDRLTARFLFAGGPEDTLVAPFELPPAFREGFRARGLELPRVAPSLDGPYVLLPWGASADAAARGRELGATILQPPPEVVRRVHAKTFVAELEERLGLERHARVFHDRGEVERAIAATFREGELWVVKRAFGFAGRGHLLGRGPTLPPNGPGFLARALERGDGVVLERWLARERDLSVALDISVTGAVTVMGVLELITGANGGFLGNRFGAIDAPTELVRIARRVGEELAREGYFGPAGIDALVHPGGLRALVEVNARFTMGRVALAFAPLLPPGGVGSWITTEARPAASERVLPTDPFPGRPGSAPVVLLACDAGELRELERSVA
jgi:hypothetical protein